MTLSKIYRRLHEEFISENIMYWYKTNRYKVINFLMMIMQIMEEKGFYSLQTQLGGKNIVGALDAGVVVVLLKSFSTRILNYLFVLTGPNHPGG